MNTLELNGQKYRLIPINRTIELIENVNGIQRQHQEFNSLEDVKRFFQRKHAFTFNENIEETVITLRWKN